MPKDKPDEELPTREETDEPQEDLPTRPRRRRVRIANGKSKLRSHVVWHEHTRHWPQWPEVIHHIDGDILNDDFGNLYLTSISEHGKMHHFGKSVSEETRTKMSEARQGGGCIVDKMVGKWGPYRYLVTKHKGKQTWKYLGRTDKFTGLVRMEDE